MAAFLLRLLKKCEHQSEFADKLRNKDTETFWYLICWDLIEFYQLFCLKFALNQRITCLKFVLNQVVTFLKFVLKDHILEICS